MRNWHLVALALTAVPVSLFANACSSDSGSTSVGAGGTVDHSTGTGGATGPRGGSAGTGGTAVNAATGCGFTGGDVTAALFPSGLTLTAGCSPYHLTGDNINVADGGSLTIQAGVTLRFEVNLALTVGLSGTGKLLASGNAQAPISMVPDTDPSRAGEWHGIQFGPGTSSSKLSYTRLDYAGGNFDAAIVGTPGVPASVVTLDHVTIDHVGTGSDGIQEQDPQSSFVITNSTFSGISPANFAIELDAASFTGIGAGNTYAPSILISVEGGIIDTTTAWANPGVPVAVTKNLVIDGANAPTLTLGAGMTLKFADGMALLVGQTTGGRLVAAGTAAAHVTFTSNGMTPRAGEWTGVKVYALGRAQLSYSDVLFGGSGMDDSKGNLSLESVASTVQLMVDHSAFNNSLGWGIYVACASAGQLGATIIVDSTTSYMANALGALGPGPTGAGCP